MKENVIINWNGIKCDNCDFKDDSIQRNEFENYINKPCSKCSENLLTFNDYLNVLKLEQAVFETNNYSIEEINEKYKDLDISKVDFMENIPINQLNKPIEVKLNMHNKIKFEKINIL